MVDAVKRLQKLLRDPNWQPYNEAIQYSDDLTEQKIDYSKSAETLEKLTTKTSDYCLMAYAINEVWEHLFIQKDMIPIEWWYVHNRNIEKVLIVGLVLQKKLAIAQKRYSLQAIPMAVIVINLHLDKLKPDFEKLHKELNKSLVVHAPLLKIYSGGEEIVPVE